MIEALITSLVETVRAASWADVVDVLLLAAAIYATLRVLRGTRAFQSLLGLALLGGVWLASDVLGFSTLRWVLDNLFVYVVLALLILFQEDIRRVLAQAGGTVLVGGAPVGTADAALVEEIVRATFAMASRRVGALVALERTASVDGVTDAGQPVGSLVTSDLLQAIFHPTSPLHDGAVLVSGGRIARAGVFLPLSMSKSLPKTFGTRHRAAVGLTERTDAVCVVVSEERGTVSLVVDGHVNPMGDASDLRAALQEALGAEPRREASGG